MYGLLDIGGEENEKSAQYYNRDLKVKVAVTAMKGPQTTNQIVILYGVYPNQVTQWKKQALEALPGAFSARRDRPRSAQSSTQCRTGLLQFLQPRATASVAQLPNPGSRLSPATGLTMGQLTSGIRQLAVRALGKT